MLQKILRIKNVGLFRDATPDGDVNLAPVATIYAENGRGKTILADILRACASQDSRRVNARRTIDSTGSIDISFLAQVGNQTAEAAFSNNAWSGPQPSLVVFDSEFVEQNVYSGFEVRADQRESLLEFALGDQTVQLKRRVEQLTEDIAVQTARQTQAEGTLTGFAAPYSVPDFISLRQIPDAQQQIDALNRRIEAARSAGQLNARQDSTPLAAIQFDVQGVFATLGKQLEDVEQSAEQAVRAHLAKHGRPGLEDWVSRGQSYLGLDECPFCGQSLQGVGLIRAYRSYFNTAYAQLKQEIAALGDRVSAALSDNTVDALAAAVATNTARIEAWRDRLQLDVPTLITKQLLTTLGQARKRLVTLVSTKLQAPLEPVGSPTDLEAVLGDLTAINQAIADYNCRVEPVTNAIREFKRRLATEDVNALQGQIRRLEAAQKRQLPQVAAAVADYQAAEAERRRLEKEKTQTRQQVDTLMNSILQNYQNEINSLLRKFVGPGLAIEEFRPTYVGSGKPRSGYRLKVRNKPVALGSRADVARTHCFANALSDADKRTLAFAFFIAKLRTDPSLADKAVVLDDPVSSLDRNRRHVSTELICDLATRCRQLMVLSHDPYFIRELRDKLGRLKPTPVVPSLHAIKAVRGGYSAFSACDIEDVCSSEYYRNYRMVSDYVEGTSRVSSRDVAKAIRPMLEGYYHRRFAARIRRKTPLNCIIAMARQATPSDPLANLKPIVPELDRINEYASQFVHDTDAAYEALPPNESELHIFADHALDLIYRNG